VIQVGEVLDKYELLERVGQGGMAVVYRGLDRSLKRVVAVKILHKHLADYQEARDRFEREAQAVAKLRHENILEIFDYSGAEDAAKAGSSYIVTEFIDGQTLKQVIVDRPIQFPEIGAMIMLQVCRALAHAHHAGILHRDVKPENIMVRSDGVVKLMDFGISHMVDLERLTVTGQLLGSPAYMAPEHVEGRQLDFRTDVFAAGIVLYQLTVGKLPFEGKNPHEVLKRIAECKFVDPRQANPQIGNRLGKIILRAMAAEPNDRFPSVGEMVTAIEGYLDESGIAHDKIAGELARYFAGPAAYEQAFEIRLVDHLTTRGQKLLAADDRAHALDVFDRVLTIDPDNEKVLAILDGINRKRRLRQTALVGLGVGVMAFCAFMVHRSQQLTIEGDPTVISSSHDAIKTARSAIGIRDEITEPVIIDAAAEPEPDARGSAVVVVPDAGVTEPDAGVALVPTRIAIAPSRGTAIQIGDGEWRPVPADGVVTHTFDKELAVAVKNECCQPDSITVKPGTPSLLLELKFKPGYVIATCEEPGVVLTLNGTTWKLGEPKASFFSTTLLDETINVEFIFKDGRADRQTVKVTFNDTKKVKCAPR
jgi:eukaryotic-like serine/threonine-protein kinase